MIKKFHLSLNMMSSRYFRAFRELSEEYRARDNRVLYFGPSPTIFIIANGRNNIP